MGTKEMFEEIRGQSFDTYRALAEEVCRYMNRHLSDFPPGYSYRDAIEWGVIQGWVGAQPWGKYFVPDREKKLLPKRRPIKDQRERELESLRVDEQWKEAS